MTERDIFSVQRFFNQLILIYDSFQSMEITTKNLNEMKQKNKKHFRHSFRVSKKKMLKTGGGGGGGFKKKKKKKLFKKRF